MSKERMPVSLRNGIEIDQDTRDLYEKRDRRLDSDPDSPPLPPERWASAMRRAEFFRPVKNLAT